MKITESRSTPVRSKKLRRGNGRGRENGQFYERGKEQGQDAKRSKHVPMSWRGKKYPKEKYPTKSSRRRSHARARDTIGGTGRSKEDES